MIKCEERDPRNASLGASARAHCSFRIWPEAHRVGSRALVLDPHSVLGLESVHFSCLNKNGDIAEARHILAACRPPNRLARFSLSATMPVAAYLRVIERDFADALTSKQRGTDSKDLTLSGQRICFHCGASHH
jgi:hypothetical protein